MASIIKKMVFDSKTSLAPKGVIKGKITVMPVLLTMVSLDFVE